MKRETQQQLQREQFVTVTDGQCEFCSYDYSKDHIKIPAKEFMVKCPKCSRYGVNFTADYPLIEPGSSDWEKENYKPCPVCGKIIDYHIDGFISYENDTVWVHRDHNAAETEKALKRPLTQLEKAWIEY